MFDRPLCFVLMPFGMKKDPAGGPDIDFDAIFEQGIRPGIEAAGLEPIRADEERVGGIIHRAMFERLLLCDFAVADLTTANANVFYELGVRHAVRPATTLAMFAKHQKLPFDIQYLRALPYELAEGNRFGPEVAAKLRSSLTERLGKLREQAHEELIPDSPLFQLLTDYKAPDIARLKTDSFRDQVRYSAKIKGALAEARRRGEVARIQAIESDMPDLDAVETGVLVDLFLSYRAVSEWDKMIALYGRLPAVLKRSVLVREQQAFALNRSGRREEALLILEGIVEEQGPSSETCGLIGRVYKDLWVQARAARDEILARGYLDRAIAAYVQGFEADWRDAYPGINAVTLLEIRGDDASQKLKAELLPVVHFAVTRRLRSAKPDYWDHATLLELAVLASDREGASRPLQDALASVRERWEPETTANNLKLIQSARLVRGAAEPWLGDIVAALEQRRGA